jgi:signal transduction histidine kinase
MYIINDIIDFSQINAEIFGLNYTTFSLLDLIQELTKLFHHEFTNKKLGLSFNIQQDTPLIIKSDQKRLMQVLVNLIQNAQKFSHYGYVCINIEAQANRVISFSVRDEGIDHHTN